MRVAELCPVILAVFLAAAGTVQVATADADQSETPPQAYSLLAGNYQLPNRDVLGIDLFPGDDGKPALLYSDYASGVVRRLFPIAVDRFGMGPGFGIASPIELTIEFIRDDQGAVTAITLQRQGQRERLARRLAIASEEVTFKNGDVTFAGTLLTPSTPGPHPAIVLLHGSGRLTRYSFGPYPHFFTSLGLAVLVYDKRASGASTGTYSPRTMYYPEVLLQDAVEAVRFLQAQDNIDPKRIGLWGTSEGGMLTTQVAARTKGIAFVINSSGFMMPLWEQVLYNIEAQLRADGFSRNDVTDAVNFEKLALKSDVAKPKYYLVGRLQLMP